MFYITYEKGKINERNKYFINNKEKTGIMHKWDLRSPENMVPDLFFERKCDILDSE